MVRTIDASRRDDLLSPSSPSALLGFLTFSHRSLDEPIRIVSDPTDFIVTTTDGPKLFVGCPFSFVLLTDEDTAPVTTLRMSNTDSRIGESLRLVSDRAQVALEIRSTADFSLSVVPRTELGVVAPIYAFSHFELVDVTVNAIDVSGTVMLRDYTQEPWPGKRATQSRTPGLFR